MNKNDIHNSKQKIGIKRKMSCSITIISLECHLELQIANKLFSVFLFLSMKLIHINTWSSAYHCVHYKWKSSLWNRFVWYSLDRLVLVCVLCLLALVFLNVPGFCRRYHFVIILISQLRHHDTTHINPAKKETPHSFKGQQLENKLLYRFVIYIGLRVKFLALIWHQICNKRPKIGWDSRWFVRQHKQTHVDYKTIQRFIFKLLALKRVRISFFAGFTRISTSMPSIH